jgi:hypothetical protein
MTPTDPKGKPPAGNSDADANPLASPAANALLEATAVVLAPLVRLLVARGITFQVASELLKRVYVRAGLDHFRADKGMDAPTGTQLSLLTGLNRKEIRRLTEASSQAEAPAGATSYAAAVHAAWLTVSRFQNADGTPLPLSRHSRGDGPSFDDLVRAVTTDHRPSALLEELQRLGLVVVEEVGDAGARVVLSDQPFLSRASFTDRLIPFAENLGDHAAAAVTNVLAEQPPFLERSVFSDELSQASVAKLQELVGEEWRRLHDELISAAMTREEADAKSGATADKRLRVGLYFYSESTKKDPS